MKSARKKSLAETHLMLSLEAIRFDCSSVSAGSGRKITWRCARGHGGTHEPL